MDDLRNSHFVVASSFPSSPPSNEVISSESDYASSSSPHLFSRNNLLLTFSHQNTSHFTNLPTLRESPNYLLSPFLNFLTRLIFLRRNFHFRPSQILYFSAWNLLRSSISSSLSWPQDRDFDKVSFSTPVSHLPRTNTLPPAPVCWYLYYRV